MIAMASSRCFLRHYSTNALDYILDKISKYKNFFKEISLIKLLYNIKFKSNFSWRRLILYYSLARKQFVIPLLFLCHEFIIFASCGDISFIHKI